MANLFSGLESMGLGKLTNMDVYEANEGQQGKSDKEDKPQITEADFIFEKSYTCPVCDIEFKSKTVKTGKVKLISADTDLRPKYQLVDSLKYDVVDCPVCGYAALNRFFNFMTSPQAKLIKASISSVYKGAAPSGDIVSYDEAITKHKLALVNTIVKKGKLSEKAYTCLKTGWLVRGKKESLPTTTPNYDKVVAQLEAEEVDFLTKAYEGFVEAYSKENFPMCGMDEATITYLLADLARRTGKTEDALRYISKVIVARDANERIKDKARQLKDLMNN
ncbi:DUF2225 domain-containing protein [Lachnoclostridium phytofermentans]|uniref:DUF2225 domain-containing protein n=1 Tax=Lachnoclostridium phytofermentans (strain ATCC 700394 / DSM 18823 / ISDg) TaxID=357809 RepID=A9KSJ5_LACP7|nr:DUF2225 domain-containing protein [Lachnoclostridium phytofermentans]ABX43647.1 conserved hypothetical protein [Lachnoclostridium phytofermentans ISDg]